MDEKKIQKMIDTSLKNSFDKRIGDTPTDAYQLTPKKYVDSQVSGRVFAGVIGTNGVPSAPFPSGWVSSQLGVGDYVVTHTINSSIFSVVSTSSAPTTTITGKSSTTFEIQTLNSAGANTNATVNFIVSKK